jgi:hypothetical protein
MVPDVWSSCWGVNPELNLHPEQQGGRLTTGNAPKWSFQPIYTLPCFYIKTIEWLPSGYAPSLQNCIPAVGPAYHQNISLTHPCLIWCPHLFWSRPFSPLVTWHWSDWLWRSHSRAFKSELDCLPHSSLRTSTRDLITRHHICLLRLRARGWAGVSPVPRKYIGGNEWIDKFMLVKGM